MNNQVLDTLLTLNKVSFVFRSHQRQYRYPLKILTTYKFCQVVLTAFVRFGVTK